MHIRFAMRFGDERYDEEVVARVCRPSAGTRKERVRAAFNSPFWPFVLVSTSVGQEGLDFHHYCHAITHWNLPSNPVDLEQREGRIHRYKGHAVRKNVAASICAEAFCTRPRMFGRQCLHLAVQTGRHRKTTSFPTGFFPAMQKSSAMCLRCLSVEKSSVCMDLRRSLAIYRMVFGQSRQEDLIAYLLAKLPEEDRAKIVAELQIELSPAVLAAANLKAFRIAVLFGAGWSRREDSIPAHSGRHTDDSYAAAR